MNAAADPKRWADYSGSFRAILDEYARAIRDLEVVLLALPLDRYTAKTVLSDEEFPDMRTIMQHTVGAAYGYADYIADALDKVDRGRRERAFDVSTPKAAADSLWVAFGSMIDVLGPIRQWDDRQQAEFRFRTRWNQDYDLEQMLEHAIVHILRHRRQLERWREAALA